MKKKSTHRVACVIPARLESSRFPRKILANLGGKPLLQWAWDAARGSDCFDDVILAIDSDKTEGVVKNFGGAYLMTSTDCACGTDRLVEVMQSGQIDADIWVNWQADEPFLNQNFINTLLSTCYEEDVDIWTLKKRIKAEKDICDPNIAKVVCDANNNAIYFSRSPIPFYRDGFVGEKVFYKHIGLFAYTTNALKKISLLKESDLEKAERLEQLRFLQNGLKIKLHETDQEVFGIDIPEHLAKAEEVVALLAG